MAEYRYRYRIGTAVQQLSHMAKYWYRYRHSCSAACYIWLNTGRDIGTAVQQLVTHG